MADAPPLAPRADDVRRGYATIAAAYRAHLLDELAGKPLDRAFLDAFAERCRGGEILEVGCGPGQVARYLADRGAAVEGLDLSPAMIEEATRSHPAVRFRVGDMFRLPHADGVLRGVVAFYAIVHLTADELVAPFCEWRRVLARDGVVAVAFHIGDETLHVDELFGCSTSLDFTLHRPEVVIDALTIAGFTLEARLDREPYPDVEHPTQRSYLLARAR